MDGVIPSRSSLEHNSILSAPLDSTETASSYESTLYFFCNLHLGKISKNGSFKSFYSAVIRHSNISEFFGNCSIPVFSSYPKLSIIIALKHNIILLSLMKENCFSFSQDLIWTHWNSHVNFVNWPFMPSATI